MSASIEALFSLSLSHYIKGKIQKIVLLNVVIQIHMTDLRKRPKDSDRCVVLFELDYGGRTMDLRDVKKEMTKTERLADMMFLLSDVKYTTVDKLREEYGRCRSVIYDDLDVLENKFNVPFVEKTAKRIMVLEGWTPLGRNNK